MKAATDKRAAPIKIILHGVREPTGHRKRSYIIIISWNMQLQLY